MLSREDKPKTHLSVRQISRRTGKQRSSACRIVHLDLQLKCMNR